MSETNVIINNDEGKMKVMKREMKEVEMRAKKSKVIQSKNIKRK